MAKYFNSSLVMQSENIMFAEAVKDCNKFTPKSDIAMPNKLILIVSITALPWMTGTTVNPLLRAGHLCRHTKAFIKRK